MKSSVGSTKDLKPLSLRRVNFNVRFLLRPPWKDHFFTSGSKIFCKSA
jgi:hypothetical protein